MLRQLSSTSSSHPSQKALDESADENLEEQYPGGGDSGSDRSSQYYPQDEADGAAGDEEDDNHVEDTRLTMAKRQTRHVRRLRMLVVLILLSATAAVSALVYSYTRNNQYEMFTTTFDGYATQILDSVQRNAQHKLEAVGALALQLQSYAITNPNTSWPFVTLPYFEEHIMATKSLTDAYGVLVFPIVSIDQKQEWEQYALQNRYWLDDSYATQRHHSANGTTDGLELENGEPGSVSAFDTHEKWIDYLWGPNFVHPENPDFSYGIASEIFKTRHGSSLDPDDKREPRIDIHNASSPNSSSYYFPQWQASPAMRYYQSTVNLDYGHYADFYQQTQIVNETRNAAYGEAWTDSTAPGFISTMLYPIFDKYYDDEDGVTGTPPKVVAFLSIDIFWQAFLKGLLPPTATDAIYVVISNTCNQTFTYSVMGEDVEFVDDGDKHESKYDSIMQSALFGEHLMEPIPSDSTYTGRPLYGDFCPYTFSVYASAEMEGAYVTNAPAIYAAIACLIFLFTSLVFVAYDCLVEKRQAMTMESAARSDAIVSSLFPSEVKQQMYDEHQNRQKTLDDQQRRRRSGGGPEEFMGNRNPNLGTIAEDNQNQQNGYDGVSSGASPIASLYPETSIIFADLVGFTSWSNGRQPSDVFLLLETIYGAFDRVAKRRGVFKVETIGDCYVAVTGIPRPQERHAVIMTRFAQECQNALQRELADLAFKLGDKTLELAMRVGIHSGPVTAGVLRGEKARFQLFGDTMNTAARMESNGMKNRIHVSQETADLLIGAGKGHWVTPREEKIEAKGKGLLQTYWVESKSSGKSIASSMISVSEDSTDRKDDPPSRSPICNDECDDDAGFVNMCEQQLEELERKLYEKPPGRSSNKAGTSSE